MKNPLEHGLFDIGNYLKDSIEEVKDYVSNGFSKIKRNVVKVGLPVSLALLTSYACSRPAPTPTHIPTPHPTPTSVIQLQKPSQPTPTVQLQRLTSPLIPTAIPTLALTPAAPSSVEISTSSCKRKIGIYNYSRTPSREGWEKIDGKLWIFGDCRIEGASRGGIYLPEKFFLNDEGWYTLPYLKLRVGWEGNDYTSELPLEKISVASAPYTTYLAGFTFEIPKVVPSFYITFRPDGGTFCNIGDSCGGGRPSFNIAKYVSASSNLTSSQPNPKLYDEWFRIQIASLFLQKMVSVDAADIRLTPEDILAEPLKIRMKIENMSRAQDRSVDLPQIYLLANNGSIMSKLKEDRYQFSVEKQILPPGYTTRSELNILGENLMKDTRYVMFVYFNRQLIVDLGSNFIPPTPLPTSTPVPTPTRTPIPPTLTPTVRPTPTAIPYKTTTVRGYVWVDQNRNFIKEPGEINLSNVEVEIRPYMGNTCAKGYSNRQLTTSSEPYNYNFDDVAILDGCERASYELVVRVPSQYGVAFTSISRLKIGDCDRLEPEIFNGLRVLCNITVKPQTIYTIPVPLTK